MINHSLFHSPIQKYSDKELSFQDMYRGQKVKVIDYLTVYDSKENDIDRVVENCSDGNRQIYIGCTGYLDTYSGKRGTPEIIVLQDEAILIKHFKVCEVV